MSIEITNPILRDGYEVDWYYPWEPPEDVANHELYQQAVAEGWHEWIQTPLDWEAVQRGYMYDMSRDHDGRPAYWIDGGWQLHDGTRVEVEDEADYIAYVGRGDHFLRFAETFLRYTKAPNEGKPYRFLPWMRVVAATIFGWVQRGDNRYRRYRSMYLALAKKNAKALCKKTPVPTPDGWKLHGNLRPGDRLYDRHGNECEVIEVAPDTLIDREVEFSNGQVVRCNKDHVWMTRADGQFRLSAKTTEEISKTLHTIRGELNHEIPMPHSVGGVQLHVEAVREIKPVLGNCITVSSPDGTYLCGETMIPTHNSFLMSIISIYMLVADETPKAQVYSCACDRNQARIIYDESATMVKKSPELSEIIGIIDSRGRLVHESSGSFYAVLSADAHRNDGVDASCVLIDEIHRHPNRKLYSVMLRAGRARPEPLHCVITTYGPSLSDGSIWAEVHTEAKQQLEGRTKTWRHAVFIASAEPITVIATADVPAGSTRIPVYRLEQPIEVSEIEFDLSQFDDADTFGTDDEDSSKLKVKLAAPAKRFQDYIEVEPLDRDLPAFSEAVANKEWRTEHGVKRANPSAGVIFPVQDLLDEAEQSVTPEKEAETMQLSFNIVAGSGRKWISGAAWQACNRWQVQPKSLIGRPVFAGLDLSFSNDLTAFGIAVPKWDVHNVIYDELPLSERRIDLLTWAWVPEDGIDDRAEIEKFPYRSYAKQTYLIDGKGPVRICPGRVINFQQVAEEITEILRYFDLLALAYDPNYGQFVIPSLVDEGFNCVLHKQGAVSMSPPCKRFSEAVYQGTLAHGDNPLLNRAIDGAQLHPKDKAGNTYLSKGKSVTRIDPLVAQVMAVGWCCDPPTEADDAYSSPEKGMWG